MEDKMNTPDLQIEATRLAKEETERAKRDLCEYLAKFV